MTALRNFEQAGPPANVMTDLHHAGFSLLPLGGGADGKGPLVSFKSKSRLPLRNVLAPMHRKGSACYGVRLEGLAVIDCDDDDPSLVEKMEARFGASPVHVRTPRGRHLFYKSSKANFPNLRGEGLPVDIKRGHGSYVMGPGSYRPDGGSYAYAKGALGQDELPEIQIETKRNVDRIQRGQRNYALTVEAVHMVEYVDQPGELFDNLRFIRDEQCDDPATIPDSELTKIAEWAWSRRLEGKVFRGRDSEFRLHRTALDALKGLPNASDAIALLVLLQDQHGHLPGRVFPLDHEAMKAAGHTDLSRRRFLDARRALEQAGLLQVAQQHRAAHHRRSYRLARLRPAAIEAGNVSQLRPAKGEGVY